MALTNPFITQTPSPTLIAGSPARITYTDLSYNVVPDISNNPTYTLRTTDPSSNNYDVFLQSQLAPQSFTPNRLFTNSNLNAPGGIVRDGSGNFYVVCLPDGAVGVPPDVSMYTSSGVFVRKITIEGGWTSLRYCGYDSSNNILYVSGEDNNVGLAGVNLSFPFPSTNDPALSIFGPGTPWVGYCRQPTYYNGYLYIAIKIGPPGYIIKYNLSNGDYLVLEATLAGTGEQPICIVINPAYVSGGNNFLYFGTVFNFSTDTHHIYAVSEITGVETSTGGTGIATITLFTTFTNSSVWGITADPSGNVYAAVVSFASFFSGPAQIARISPTDPTRQNLTGVSFGGTAIAGRIRGLLFDGSANLYVADESNDRVLLTQPKTFIFGGPTSIVNGEAYFDTDKRTTYLYDISNNEVDTSFLLNPAECFKKGTKILCENDMYVPIEELKIGDLVKTYKHGYQKVIRTANGRLCDYPQSTLNQLYTYSREKNPALIEDLHLTGGHSLLLDTLADEELCDMNKINWSKEDFMVEDKYKLLACFSRDIHVSAEQNVEIYHFTLEPPENARLSYVYGVYANGILAESCSHGAMDKKLGENRILSSSNPVIIRPPTRLPDPLPTPLVYNDSIDTTNMTNIMLIDSTIIDNKELYDSANANTFPIIYNYTSSTDDLLALLRQKFSASSIQRIALVFHDRGTNFMVPFMNNNSLFEESDLIENQTSFTENVSFLIDCIKEFNIANIDFLACNTLQYSNWKSYYSLLVSQTSVVVGASNDATGNVQYGGDWVMESTGEDVKQTYFTDSIDYYKYLLATYTLDNIVYTYTIGNPSASVSGYVTGITTANIPTTITPGATYDVTSIVGSAFFNATSLTSVTIPSSVTSIGARAFKYCNRLTSFAVDASNPNYSNDSFGVLFNKLQTSLIQYTTGNTRTSYTIPSSVTSIQDDAFVYARLLTSVTIPDSVTSIGSGAFYYCDSLTSVIISSFVTSIGSVAFDACTALTSFAVDASNPNYSSDAFGVLFNKLKTSLIQYPAGNTRTSYTIPSSVTSIQAHAFAYSRNLTSVTIPNSVTSIGDYAFYYCSSLTSVTIPSSVTSIASYTFSDCSSLTSVSIPNSVTSIGTFALAYCTSLTSVTIPSSVTSIASYAFYYSDHLTSVTIPSSVTSIGDSAFESCSALNLVYFLQTSTLPTIGTSAFAGIATGSVGKYYSSVTDTSSIAPPVFSSISAISTSPPTLTSIIPFNSPTISYTGLVTNGNEVVSNPPFVFLVNSVTSGSLLIGATQGTATAWDASNNTINSSNNAYWTPPTGTTTGLLDAFSVVVQDTLGAVSSPNVQVQVDLLINIIVDGSTNSIYLRMLSGVMQYSIGTLSLPGSWTSIASGDWPVQITNSNSSSVLRVVATENLTITSSYGGTSGYFVPGSSNITFDGSGNTITLDTITDYPGFIQNGASGVIGFANIIVQNFTTAISGGSTLASSAGWLCQSNFGYGASGNQIISCTNTGPIGGTYAGGIAGIAVGAGGGSVSFTRCANTGTISGNSAGGIVGGSAESTTITNCFNIGIISGNGAGGIAGNWFGYNSNGTCSIYYSYSTGAINGTNAGGIVGAGVGFTDNGTNISLYIVYCYSLGAISSTAGGICGGIDGSYVGTGNVYIQNSYSWGVLTTPGSGIVATSLPTTPITISQYGTYVANGAWSDTAANAGLVNFNPSSSPWVKIANNTTTPYVLKSFNAQLYSPNSATTSASNYTTSAGLFTDPSYNYQIVYNNIFNNVVTTSVFVSKGTTSPYYYSYNTNTFTLTPTSSASYITNITITPSNGILNYLLTTSLANPVITQTPSPTLIAGSPARITYTDLSYNIVPDISNNPTYTLRTTDPSSNNYDVFLQSQDAPQSFTPNSLFTNSNLRFPGGIVRDGSGNFYVVCLASSGNPPGVVMFTPSGTYIGRISIEGGYTALRYGGYDSLNNRLYVASETAGVGLVGINLSNPPPSSNDPTLSILPNAPWAGACRQSVYKNGYLYIAVLYTPNILKYNLRTNDYLVLDVSPVTSVGAVCLVLNPTYVSGGNNLLYVGTSGGVIYAVSEITGTEISTGGTGIATLTRITNVYDNSWIWGITADPEANLYAGAGAINAISTIIRISPTNPSRQQITCISYAGVNVIYNIRGLLFDGSANLYVVDNGNDRVLLTRPKTFIFGGPTSIVNGEAYFNTDKRTTYLYDISNNEVDTSFLLNPAECFKKGTKILCENDMYVPIEELKIGDLVKTYKHGYQKVIRIVNNKLCDYPQSILSQLYTYSRKKNPYLKEDLHLTGGHSLLLASLTEEESNGMKQVNWQKEDFMVEDKYKLLSYLSSELCIAVEQNVEIYNFTLEPPENAKPSYVYGIYANGILAESCSRGAMDKSLGETRMLCDSSKTEQE